MTHSLAVFPFELYFYNSPLLFFLYAFIIPYPSFHIDGEYKVRTKDLHSLLTRICPNDTSLT